MTNDLTFRRALPGDFDAVAAVLFADPAKEELAIAGGSAEMARRWGRAQLLLRGLGDVHVGEMNGEIVVVLEIGPSVPRGGRFARLHALKFELSRALAWARTFSASSLPRYVALRRAEHRAYPPLPPDAYHFAEMTTVEKYRYSGIGAHARVYGEKQARRLGYRKMSLHTSVINPTKDMVMRHGYELVATGNDARYERLTGIAGWHLLVKELKQRPPRPRPPTDEAGSASG